MAGALQAAKVEARLGCTGFGQMQNQLRDGQNRGRGMLLFFLKRCTSTCYQEVSIWTAVLGGESRVAAAASCSHAAFTCLSWELWAAMG